MLILIPESYDFVSQCLPIIQLFIIDHIYQPLFSINDEEMLIVRGRQ